jgi:Tfp pilus assembly protein PilX
MKKMITKPIRNIRGYALVIMVCIMPLMFLITETVTKQVRDGLSFSENDAGLRQALYIAEAGEKAALYELALSNYSKYTHRPSGIAVNNHSEEYLPITLPNTVHDQQGWHHWEWKPGDSHNSFTSSGVHEEYRFKISSIGRKKWIIEVESSYGDRYQHYQRKILSEFDRQIVKHGVQEPVSELRYLVLDFENKQFIKF